MAFDRLRLSGLWCRFWSRTNDRILHQSRHGPRLGDGGRRDRRHPADRVPGDARRGDGHLCRSQGARRSHAAARAECRRPVRHPAKLCRRAEGVPAGNHHSQRGEQGHVPARADHHFHRGAGGLGGDSVQRDLGAGGYQCRPAVHSRDLVALGLRGDDGGLGEQFEVPVLLRHARRRADDFVRSLDRLHPRLRGAVCGHVQPERYRARAAGLRAAA